MKASSHLHPSGVLPRAPAHSSMFVFPRMICPACHQRSDEVFLFHRELRGTSTDRPCGLEALNDSRLVPRVASEKCITSSGRVSLFDERADVVFHEDRNAVQW
jgi:hypothetical protein